MQPSNEPTTDQINETIALFMGYERYEDKYGIWFKTEGLITCLHRKLQDLNYHTSWDALMPVVRKIKYDNNSAIRMESNGIADSIMPYIKAMQPMNRALINAHLQSAYEGVYKFITWYNQQKKTHDTR